MVIRVKQGVVGIRRHARLGGRRALVGGLTGGPRGAPGGRRPGRGGVCWPG